MHRVSKLHICNFRACRDLQIELDAFTPIVGPNNAGKSTILSALAWFLSPTTLVERDFRDSTKPVEVTIKATGISSAVLGALAEKHRKKIEPFVDNEHIFVRRVCAAPGTTGGKTDVLIRDPTVADESDPAAWSANPTGIWSAVRAMFPDPIRVGAMEDSAEDATKSKTSTTLGKLLAELTDDVVGQLASDYANALAGIDAQLSADGTNRPSQLTDFDTEASAAVANFFPGVDVALHIPTPELKDLVKAGTLMTTDNGVRRDFGMLGHGAQRAIQMALIRVLADRKKASTGSVVSRLLLIDEPELYLHPGAIFSLREALRELSTVGYQVVVTTHSPILVEESQAASAVIVGKDPADGTFARPTMRAAVAQKISDAPSQARCLFSLTHASEILFSERVVLAEGTTEKRLLPLLFKAATQKTLRSKSLALVDLGGVNNIALARQILDAMGMNSCVIADLDFMFRGAVTAGWLPQDDPDLIACKVVMASKAESNGWKLNSTGLFEKNKVTGKKAATMYEELAAHASAQQHIASLRAALLGHNVWIWSWGAIEPHLGISSKNEAAWATLAQDIEDKGLAAAVTDDQGIQEFAAWLDALV